MVCRPEDPKHMMTTRRLPWLLLWLPLGLVTACAPGADATHPDRDRGHLIELGSLIIDTQLVAPDTAPMSTAGDGYVLVKFPAPVTAAQLQALSASAQIYTYLPHDAFLVRPTSGGAAG